MGTPYSLSVMRAPVEISWTYLNGSFGRSSKGKSGSSFAIGNCVDSAMRKWVNDMDSSISDHIKSGNDSNRSTRKALRAAGILQPVLEELISSDGPGVRSGVRFRTPEFDADGVPAVLTGEMDLLFTRDSGEKGVFDLKVTESSTYWRSTLGQLHFYAIALEMCEPGVEISRVGIVQPLASPRLLTWNRSEMVDETLMSQVTSIAHRDGARLV
jgi:hypothetical protein